MIEKEKSKKKTKKKVLKKIVKEADYLHKSSTVITMEEFKKFQKFYLNKFKSTIIPKIIMVVLALLVIIINIIKKDYDLVGIVIVFVICYPLVLNFALNRQIKKMYKSNKRINELEEFLYFYDDYLESKSKHNYCKVMYEDIYKICETKSNFYIFVSENQAFIVIKNNIKDVDGLRELLSKKAKYRRYR